MSSQSLAGIHINSITEVIFRAKSEETVNLARYIIEPITLWTAVASITGALAIGGSFVGWIRNLDKAVIDNRFCDLDKAMNQITSQLPAKASKDEMDKSVARLERDIQAVRAEQKAGFIEIRQDIKEMRHELITLIKDVKEETRRL